MTQEMGGLAGRDRGKQQPAVAGRHHDMVDQCRHPRFGHRHGAVVLPLEACQQPTQSARDVAGHSTNLQPGRHLPHPGTQQAVVGAHQITPRRNAPHDGLGCRATSQR